MLSSHPFAQAFRTAALGVGTVRTWSNVPSGRNFTVPGGDDKRLGCAETLRIAEARHSPDHPPTDYPRIGRERSLTQRRLKTGVGACDQPVDKPLLDRL